jgi:hypothetical protein
MDTAPLQHTDVEIATGRWPSGRIDRHFNFFSLAVSVIYQFHIPTHLEKLVRHGIVITTGEIFFMDVCLRLQTGGFFFRLDISFVVGEKGLSTHNG